MDLRALLHCTSSRVTWCHTFGTVTLSAQKEKAQWQRGIAGLAVATEEGQVWPLVPWRLLRKGSQSGLLEDGS